MTFLPTIFSITFVPPSSASLAFTAILEKVVVYPAVPVSAIIASALMNIFPTDKQNEYYLKSSRKEAELCNRFERLDLSKEQKDTMRQWTEAIHAQNAAYIMVMFRMAMQYCFSY